MKEFSLLEFQQEIRGSTAQKKLKQKYNKYAALLRYNNRLDNVNRRNNRMRSHDSFLEFLFTRFAVAISKCLGSRVE